MNHFVLLALAATLGTWFVTALGAATVAFFKSPNQKALNLMLGFASGVMIAASFWSLLQPAIERAETASTLPAYVVATTGFLLGALFMWGSDKIVSFARKNADSIQNQNRERLNRIIMLVLSITLHNIPEGLAVGVAFGALQRDGYTTERLIGAITIAVGIGLQKFPRGCGCVCPPAKRRLLPEKEFSDWAGLWFGGTRRRRDRSPPGGLCGSHSALCPLFCRRRHDSGGGT